MESKYQVKIFTDHYSSDLESTVNKWLNENLGSTVISICQSESSCYNGYRIDSNKTITVFYKK